MKKDFPLQPYILKALRRIFAWYPPRRQCKDAAELEDGSYLCAECLGPFPRKSVVVDHIDPVVDTSKGFQGYDEYIKRLFCSIDNLQALCKACHNKKSKAENALRRSARAKRKS